MNLKSSIFFLLLDFGWIFCNLNTYNNLVYTLQGQVIEFNKLKIVSLIITYAFLLYGLNYIVLPYNIPISFGAVVYGVYSFTNYSLFNNYPFKLAVIDTIWGIILYYISNNIK